MKIPKPHLRHRYPGSEFCASKLVKFQNEVYVSYGNQGLNVYTPDGKFKRRLQNSNRKFPILDPDFDMYTVLAKGVFSLKTIPKEDGRKLCLFNRYTGEWICAFWTTNLDDERDFIYDITSNPKTNLLYFTTTRYVLEVNDQGKLFNRIPIDPRRTQSFQTSPYSFLVDHSYLFIHIPDTSRLYIVDLQEQDLSIKRFRFSISGKLIHSNGFFFQHSMYTNELRIFLPWISKWIICWNPDEPSGLTSLLFCQDFLFCAADKTGGDERVGLEIWNCGAMLEFFSLLSLAENQFII